MSETKTQKHFPKDYINLPYVFCQTDYVQIIVPAPLGSRMHLSRNNDDPSLIAFEITIHLPADPDNWPLHLYHFTEGFSCKPGAQVYVTTVVDDGTGDNGQVRGDKRGTTSLPDSPQQMP